MGSYGIAVVLNSSPKQSFYIFYSNAPNQELNLYLSNVVKELSHLGRR